MYLAVLRTGRTVVTTFVLHVVFPAILHSSLSSEGFSTLSRAASATISVSFKSLALNMRTITITITISMTSHKMMRANAHLSRTLIVSCSLHASLLTGRRWRWWRRNPALGQVGVPLAVSICLAFQWSEGFINPRTVVPSPIINPILLLMYIIRINNDD